MNSRTVTSAIVTNRPDQLVDALSRLVKDQYRFGLVFVSGSLSATLSEVAQSLAVHAKHVDWLILPTLGVLTERGEIEGQSAAAVLLTETPVDVLISPRPDPSFGARICASLEEQPGSSALVALRADDNDAGWLSHVDHHFRKKTPRLFGGGLLPRLDAIHVREGMIFKGAAVAAVIPSVAMGRFGSSTACRLISPLRIVTKARGPVLHEIEGMLALQRLAEATSDLGDHPLVLLAIAAGDEPLSRRGRTLALRTILGVDPGRGALIFGEPISEGARVAFAARDAHASRTDLQAQLGSLKFSCAGTAPEFGIFINCAGRGSGLYGSEDVDIRLIKRSFPNLPLVGMHSTFELAPLAGRAVPQIYTAVLGVFCRPS